jgi:hypothetical protein
MADLQGADLRGANLESAHLKGVINAEYALIDQTQRSLFGLADNKVTKLQQKIKQAEQAIQEKKELKRKIQQLEDNSQNLFFRLRPLILCLDSYRVVFLLPLIRFLKGLLVRLLLSFPLIFPLIYLCLFFL